MLCGLCNLCLLSVVTIFFILKLAASRLCRRRPCVPRNSHPGFHNFHILELFFLILPNPAFSGTSLGTFSSTTFKPWNFLFQNFQCLELLLPEFPRFGDFLFKTSNAWKFFSERISPAWRALYPTCRGSPLIRLSAVFSSLCPLCYDLLHPESFKNTKTRQEESASRKELKERKEETTQRKSRKGRKARRERMAKRGFFRLPTTTSNHEPLAPRPGPLTSDL